MISKRLSAMGLTLIATLSLASIAPATIVINPTSAPAVAAPTIVSGTGAKANGPVELYVNGLSRGSVTANGSGNFTFPSTLIASTDVLRATASQVWNFNTNGDAEGWVSISASSVVSGGILTATTTAAGNVTMNFDPAGATPAIIDTALTRVFEIRYRITGSYTGGGDTVIYDPGSGFQFGPSWNPAVSASFTTSVIDLTNGAGNNYISTGTSLQLAPGLNGMGAGTTLEIDYIRLTEYIDFGFNNDGDTMNLTPIGGSLTVVGGVAQLTNTTAGTNAFLTGPFSQIDTNYFNRFRTRIDAGPTIDPNLMTFQYLASGFLGGGYNVNWDPISGTNVATNIDLTTAPTFGVLWGSVGTLNRGDGFFSPMFPNTAGELAKIDFIRLTPATTFGPSAPVTVTLGSQVSDWMTY